MRELRNPDRYHGFKRRNDFFEGWYFKIVDAARENAFALIPGIFYGSKAEHHHSFIQVVQARGGKYNYLSYPVNSFVAEQGIFSVKVDKSRFSLNKMQLDIDDPGIRIQGNLEFDHVVKWPDSWLHPGSMGFYNYIPNMQCYAQVCAMDLDLEGELCLEGQIINFNGGKGYVEKNWGKAFPYSWIWIQSNHFENHYASLSCSLAHIPFLAGSFRGFLIGLFLDGQFYAFTTMNRSKMKILQRETDVSIRVENSAYVMTMDTETRADDFIQLNGPRNGEMIPLVQENLSGRVGVSLLSKRNGKVIFQSVGECAGIEYGGNQMLVLDEVRGKGKGIRNE